MYQQCRAVLCTVVNLSRVLLLVVVAVALLAGGRPVGDTTTTAHPTAARTVQPVRVVVVDHTHGWRGVSAAVAGWNRSPYVHLIQRRACVPGVFCVVLVAGDYGSTDWVARTHQPVHGRSLVQVNLAHAPQSGTTDLWPTAVVCHELGHALGVAHSEGSNSARGCIAATDAGNVTATASDDDLLALAVVRNTGRGGLGWGAVYRTGQ